MTFTQLDPKAALVVIDLQKGIAGIPAAHPAKDIIQHSAQLAEAFRKKGLPIVWVNVTGAPKGRTDAPKPDISSFPSNWAELVDELNVQPDDLHITKQCWGAFGGTDLHELLQKNQVTQIVLTGIATSAGVESTARSAYELGYSTLFVTDAMTDRDLATHTHSVEKIFPRIGEVTDTQTIIQSLK
jgi:nicotinamidase-related amidase